MTYRHKRKGIGFKPSLFDTVKANVAAITQGGALPPDLQRSLDRMGIKPPRARVAKPKTGPSEHQEQVAVIGWWRRACNGYGLPEFALFAIPNGGGRSMVQGALLKAEGVRAGVYDLFLASKGNSADRLFWKRGLFIEMKVRPNKPTVEQVAFGYMVTQAGYAQAVCYSAEEAIAEIKRYLAT